MRLLPGRADHDRGGAARRDTRTRRTQTSTTRWPAISAAAAPTRGSARRSSAPPPKWRRWEPEPWPASGKSPAALSSSALPRSPAARPSATTSTASPTPNPLQKDLAEGEATFNPYVKIAPRQHDHRHRAALRDGAGRLHVARRARRRGARTSASTRSRSSRAGRLGLLQHRDARRGRAVRLLQRGRRRRDRARADGRCSARLRACRAPAARPRCATASSRCARRARRRARCWSRRRPRARRSRGELVAENGTITHKASGKSVTYGEVAAEAARLDVPADVTAQGQERVDDCSASRSRASTCWPRSPARRSSASTSLFPTCSLAR